MASLVVTWLAVAAGGLVGLALGVGVRRSVRSRSYRYADERDLRIPRQGWLVPLGSVLGAGMTWAYLDRPATLVLFLALLWPLLRLAAIDQDVHRLPDRITKPLYPVLALALLVPALVEDAWPDYVRAMIAALVGFVVYLVLAVVGRGGLGLGDVKLAGILGMACGWVSWSTLVAGLVAGIFLAAAWAAYLLVTRRATRKDYVPLGPFLIVGAVLSLVVAP